MSALPPKADMCGANTDVCYGPIADMCSALAHVRFVPRADIELLDHLVGGREQRLRHVEPERLGGLEIDGELKFGRLRDR